MCQSSETLWTMFSNGLLVKNVQVYALGCDSPVTGVNLVTSRCFPPLGSIACLVAKSLQSYPTLCDPIDSSPPGCPVPGILQARTTVTNAITWASQVALVVKNLPADAGDIRDTGSVPGLGRCSGEGKGNPYSILAWRISWTEEPGGLQSMGSQRVGHDWSELARTQVALAVL